MRKNRKYLIKLIQTGSKLQKYVAQSILKRIGCYSIKSYLSDVINHGCVSGMVCGLISYTETNDFFLKYQEEINEFLFESLDSHGFAGLAELFGDRWKTEDPLALSVYNRNLLAWFVYEQTCYQIANELGFEI